MIYANQDGKKAKATPSARGTCPGCDAEVIAKCGEIKAWHWAHKASAECDSFHEPMSDWHLEWQEWLESQGATLEDVVIRHGKRHRADARLPGGHVIEVQHSPISSRDVQAREMFYGHMSWIFDARSRAEPTGDGRIAVRWPTLAYVTKPIALDLGGGELLVSNGGQKVTRGNLVVIPGRIVDRSKLIDAIRANVTWSRGRKRRRSGARRQKRRPWDVIATLKGYEFWKGSRKVPDVERAREMARHYRKHFEPVPMVDRLKAFRKGQRLQAEKRAREAAELEQARIEAEWRDREKVARKTIDDRLEWLHKTIARQIRLREQGQTKQADEVRAEMFREWPGQWARHPSWSVRFLDSAR